MFPTVGWNDKRQMNSARVCLILLRSIPVSVSRTSLSIRQDSFKLYLNTVGSAVNSSYSPTVTFGSSSGWVDLRLSLGCGFAFYIPVMVTAFRVLPLCSASCLVSLYNFLVLRELGPCVDLVNPLKSWAHATNWHRNKDFEPQTEVQAWSKANKTKK